MILDANIFIEVMLEQEQAKACERVLKKIQRGELRATICDVTIHTILFALARYKRPPKVLRLFVLSLLQYKGLHIHNTGLGDCIVATVTMEEFSLDLDDSFVVHTALINDESTILSLDKHFDSVKGIKRIVPSEI